MTQPLAGVRVIEFGTVLMVPFAGQVLADLGADVIKVESLEGDPNRQVGAGPHPDLSGVALNLNRNKRSLAVDVRAAGGRAVLERLAATADVFLTNLRPLALDKLGVSYADVRHWRPDIVYCRSHGYGSDSGRADEPAYDDVVQAASGIAGLSERTRGEPELLPTVLADKVSGLTIAYGVLAALFQRATTGQGQEVEVPMFDTMVAFTLVEHLAGATTRPPLSTPGYDRVLTPHRRPHRTADGWIVVMPYSPRDWDRLWEHLDEHGHRARLRGLSPHEVKRLAPQMYGWLDEILVERSTAEWVDTFVTLDIAAAPVASLDELVDGPARELGVLREATHPLAGPYLEIRGPVRFSGAEASEPRPAPLIGQDSLDLLAELGIDPLHARNLVESGTVRVPEPPLVEEA
ncbi:CoA transferase [Pseudonocardia ailaonensis]|uniref:CoA transferase n=1 Tax=Pseudonocardia ailaonensis TaxID=367279 RepID=A0ABN2N5A1_9PSEU